MSIQDNGLSAYASLGSDLNKQKVVDNSLETKQGIVSEKLPELTLETTDDDLIKITDKWEKDWKDSPKKQEWEKQIGENEKYWLGNQFDNPKSDKNRPMVDNILFESLETYLPQATRRNPEPLVTLDASELDENGNPKDPNYTKYVQKVKNRLADLADKNVIRLKLKKGARHWSIFQLGVSKFGWDLDEDIPIIRIVRPQRIILDPDATIDEDGYNGNRVGEYRKMEASKILVITGDSEETKKAQEKIKELVKDDLETIINFIEWWTPQYMCWKLGDTILLKKKNPHWNYNQQITSENVDDYGTATQNQEEVLGINHFKVPQMPYSFLSVFNLGDQPMDKTSLIQQNLSNQDKINKRNKQIDKNADRMNGGMVVSLERSGLTQAQAKNVTESLRKGGVVAIPSGSPREAIESYSPGGLPNDIYNDLIDTRNRTRDIFGVKGSSQSGLENEKTVRGKIISRSLDTDRIGGGVTEYLEQWADDWYNWFLQLLYVYDTGFQFIQGAVPPKLVVSVKEGSLLPKDSTSLSNQAMELASMGKISNIDLYKKLEYPNPEELAANVWLETNAPHLLYKNNQLVQEALMMMQQSQAQNMSTESENKESEHAKNIEMERVKAEAKAENSGNRSILSAVPQG